MTIVTGEEIAGFEAPVHRSLTEPILLAGAPRAVAIINGTVSAALGLGLRLWIAGLVLWAIGHMAAVWAAKRDPFFVEVVRRHVRYPAHLGCQGLRRARLRAQLFWWCGWAARLSRRRCARHRDDLHPSPLGPPLGLWHEARAAAQRQVVHAAVRLSDGPDQPEVSHRGACGAQVAFEDDYIEAAPSCGPSVRQPHHASADNREIRPVFFHLRSQLPPLRTAVLVRIRAGGYRIVNA